MSNTIKDDYYSLVEELTDIIDNPEDTRIFDANVELANYIISIERTIHTLDTLSESALLPERIVNHRCHFNDVLFEVVINLREIQRKYK